VGGGELGREQVGAHFGARGALFGQIGLLEGGGSGYVGQLRERGEVTVTDQRGDGCADDGFPEEPVDELLLCCGQAFCRGSGQTDDVGVGKISEDLVEQAPPHLEQVVTLVEQECERSCVVQGFHQGTAVGVQPVPDGGGRAALFVGLGVGVEDRQGLVREYVDVVDQPTIGSGGTCTVEGLPVR